MKIFVAILLLMSTRAHYVMKIPEPRTGSSPSKTSPCGGRAAAGSPITSLQANSFVNISWFIQQSHSKQTTISLSAEGSDTFSCVLLARVPNIASGGGKEAMVSVWIPNVKCDNCAIQVANDDWYTCTQVKINGQTPRASFQCQQPCSWPYYNFTTNSGTTDPRWQLIPTSGRPLYYLDVYGKSPAFAASASQPAYTGACLQTAAIGNGNTMLNGQLSIPTGTSYSVAQRLVLTGTTAILIRSGTRTLSTVQLTIEGPSDRWFAVGFGAQMLTTDAIIWSAGKSSNSVNNMRLEDYYLTAKTLAGVVKDAVQDWTLVANVVEGGKTVITVQRAINTGDNQDIALNAATTPIIWAMGSANGYQLAQHGGTGADRAAAATTLTWQTVTNTNPGTPGSTAPPGGTTTGTTTGGPNGNPGGNGTNPSPGPGGGAKSETVLVSQGFGVYGAPLGTSSISTSVHGVFMLIAWGVLIPFAVIINRYRDQFAFLSSDLAGEKLWFQLHRGFNLTSFLFMFIGLCVKWGELAVFTIGFHSILGITLILLAAISIAVGFCRPAEDSSNRGTWLMVHRYAGFSYLFMAFIQACVGLSIGGAGIGSILLFTFWVLLLMGITGFLEWRRWNGASAKVDSANTQASVTAHGPSSGQAIVAVNEGEAPTRGVALGNGGGPPPPVPPTVPGGAYTSPGNGGSPPRQFALPAVKRPRPPPPRPH